MNYDQRIDHIKRWFKEDVVKRFSMPRDLDPLVVATDIIEAVNSHLPSKVTPDQMSHLLNQTLATVTRNANSRTIPIPKAFIDAATQAGKKRGEAHTEAQQDDGYQRSLNITEARIRAGEPISDTYLRGIMREMLLSKTSITNADLVPYETTLARGANLQ